MCISLEVLMSLLNACSRFRQTFTQHWAHPLYEDHKQINYLNSKREHTPKRLTGIYHMLYAGCLFVASVHVVIRPQTLRPFVVGRSVV